MDAPALKPLALAFLTGDACEGGFKVDHGSRTHCVVLYDFSPSSESELALVAGETVFVDISSLSDEARSPDDPSSNVRNAARDGWVKGVAEATGLVGYFPVTYVAAVANAVANAAAASSSPDPPLSPATPAKRPPDRRSVAYSIKSLDAFDELLSSGLSVEEAAPGTGPKAATGDRVTLKCTASSWDGGNSAATPFASTEWQGETKLVFVLGARTVTDGLELAVSHLALGASCKATVAPNLAYGAAGYPPDVKPGAFIIYDLELVKLDKDASDTPQGPLALCSRPVTSQVHGSQLGAFSTGRPARLEVLPPVPEHAA